MLCVGGYDFPLPPIYAGNMAGNLAARIKALRVSKGYNQTEMAERLGVTQSTVTRWENGALPRADQLKLLADMANTSVERLLGADSLSNTPADMIPVVGYVGAGAAVFPFDDHAPGDGMDHVDRPPFVHGAAVSVEVRGDSLYPVAEDGWRLIYAGEQTIIEADVLNRLCVVQLEDGRMLVKRLMRGTKPQHYHLVSTNAPTIEDAKVVWAAMVKAIIPR